MRFIRALLYLITLPAIFGVLFGYFGSVHPSLDSLSHLRLHLAVIAAAGGLLLALSRRKAIGFLVILSSLFALSFHMGHIPDRRPAEAARALLTNMKTLIGDMLGITLTIEDKPQGAGPRYKMLHANLRFDNGDASGFLRLAGEAGADVLMLNEVSRAWLPTLVTLKGSYPSQLICPTDSGNGGVAILSKRPFTDHAENGCSNGGALALQHVDFGGRETVLSAVYLNWPWPHTQARQITEMRERLRANAKDGLPLIFAGDLNAAPWSHSVKRLASFLKAQRVTVPGGTWIYHEIPAEYAKWAGLPLDNVLSRGIEIARVGTMPPFGSDHLAVRLEFAFPEQ